MYYKAYAILAHKNPIQLKELISKLEYSNTYFFIHIDKKSSIDSFIKEIKGKNCFFIDHRKVCSWGTFSLVNATLELFKSIDLFMSLNHKNANYHAILLSGEDYPVKSNDKIHDFLKNNENYSFINYWTLPYKQWWNGGLFRFESLYLFNYSHKRLNKYTNKIIKKINLEAILPINRLKKNFPEFQLLGNSQWVVLNKLILIDLLRLSKDKKKIKSIFRYTLAPDETYFSSILLNYSTYKENIINQNLTFIRFNGNENSPEYLKISRLKGLKYTDYLFARKFSFEINKKSISYIHNNFIENE